MTGTPNTNLPDPFAFADGRRIAAPSDWPKRRRQMLDEQVDIEYGGMPPDDGSGADIDELNASVFRPIEGARYFTYRVSAGPGRDVRYTLYASVPPGDGPFPAVLTGDLCWRLRTDEIVIDAVRRGYAMFQFNRTEIVPDIKKSGRSLGLYRAFPGAQFGALAAWAWGYHRAVDALGKLPYIDASRIAVVGHSRGGKTALLAGATDERIALTGANCSGAGGAGCFRRQGPKSETLSDLLRAFPYWYGPKIAAYEGREAELPFDQHCLKAAVAPRPLLTCEALGDLWANPTGAWQTFEAAREVYRYLGAPDNIGIVYRAGEHQHSLGDWQAFLDFADWRLRGLPPTRSFAHCPFADLPKAYDWTAP